MSVDSPRPLGPNLKKLIIRKMCKDAIPDGGGLADGIKFMTTKGAAAAGWAKAKEWADMAISLIRNAPGPNPWADYDEESIAAELVRRIEAMKK